MEEKKESKTNKVVVILSGGLDSTTMLYDLVDQNYNIMNVLTFNYGQRHKREIQSAIRICEELKLEHCIVDISNLRELLKGSALTDNIDVPEGHYKELTMKLTIVPNRNSIMLAIAIGNAVSLKANYVAYAAHAGDHAIYPDCRREFVERFSFAEKIANYQPVEVLAPYLGLTKIEILKRGLKLNIPYKLTWTCYQGKEKPCGRCGACQERLEAFQKNNLKDPLKYE